MAESSESRFLGPPSVRARTAENVAILLVLQWIIRVFAVVTKIVLARILFPEDFGIFALAAGLIGITTVLGNFGLDYALIQRSDAAREEDYEVAMSLRVALSVILLATTMVVAFPWAALFGVPALARASQVLAIVYLITPWGFVPTVKLLVKLDYRRLIVPNVLLQVVNSGLSIGLAILGFGFWSLIAAMVVSQIAWVVSVSFAHPWRPRFRFSRAVAKPLLSYSQHLLLASLLTFLMTNVDNFTVGYLLGPATLGYYAIAYSLCLFSSMVSGSAASALFPSLSKIQADPERVRRGYLESFAYASATVAPIAIGLAVMAPEIVRVLLGAVWTPSIVPLVILAFYGFAKALVDFTAPLFASMGQPKALPRLNGLILGGSVLLLFPLTLMFGIAGTAVAMLLPISVAVVVAFHWAAGLLKARIGDFVTRLAGPLLAAETAGITAGLTKWILYAMVLNPRAGLVADLVALVAALAVGGLVYVFSLRVVDREVYLGLGRHLRLVLPLPRP